jgi:hypothetical protein
MEVSRDQAGSRHALLQLSLGYAAISLPKASNRWQDVNTNVPLFDTGLPVNRIAILQTPLLLSMQMKVTNRWLILTLWELLVTLAYF